MTDLVFSYASIALIPCIIGLGTLFLQVGFPKKFVPLVNLALGIAAGIVLLYPADIRSGAVVGIFIGLSSSGLYSGVKNVAQGITPATVQQVPAGTVQTAGAVTAVIVPTQDTVAQATITSDTAAQ